MKSNEGGNAKKLKKTIHDKLRLDEIANLPGGTCEGYDERDENNKQPSPRHKS
jgi:hypothetical protein